MLIYEYMMKTQRSIKDISMSFEFQLNFILIADIYFTLRNPFKSRTSRYIYYKAWIGGTMLINLVFDIWHYYNYHGSNIYLSTEPTLADTYALKYYLRYILLLVSFILVISIIFRLC